MQIINFRTRRMTLKKVEGHSNDKMNEYVDFLTWLKHKYKKTTLKLKGSLLKRTRLPNDIKHYRLYDVVKGISEKKLDMKKFKNRLLELKKQLYLVAQDDNDTATATPNG